jgi:hypothetical protein
MMEPDLSLDDDRNAIQPGDQVLLMVEDDPVFAQILVEAAREHGLKAVAALRGSTAITLAKTFKPAAITLDVRLPDMSGWVVLDHLKHDPETRHIPVHVVSGVETTRDGFALGAMTCLGKAAGRQVIEQIFPRIQESMQKRKRTLLLVSGSEPMRDEIRTFLALPDCEFLHASGEAETLHLLLEERVDGMIVDWAVSELGGIEFIETIQRRFDGAVPPMVILGSPRIDPKRAADLHRLARTSAVRYAPSLERLLNDVVLLLHRSEDSLSLRHQEILAQVRETDLALAGRKVLVVDDDLRNIFALTSVLEQSEMTVLHAENGKAGIALLQKNPNIDLVLMDIMMPEMDGYETTRAIRQLPHFRSTPIIALTAKAMKGDREKCLQAGASDYVTKPVDLNYLFSVMRVWLAKLGEHAGILAQEGHENRRLI